MKNRKLRFIRAVRLTAPQNKLVLQFAASLTERGDLPEYPGAPVIEPVAVTPSLPSPARRTRWPRRDAPPASHPERP